MTKACYDATIEFPQYLDVITWLSNTHRLCTSSINARSRAATENIEGARAEFTVGHCRRRPVLISLSHDRKHEFHQSSSNNLHNSY